MRFYLVKFTAARDIWCQFVAWYHLLFFGLWVRSASAMNCWGSVVGLPILTTAYVCMILKLLYCDKGTFLQNSNFKKTIQDVLKKTLQIDFLWSDVTTILVNPMKFWVASAKMSLFSKLFWNTYSHSTVRASQNSYVGNNLLELKLLHRWLHKPLLSLSNLRLLQVAIDKNLSKLLLYSAIFQNFTVITHAWYFWRHSAL